MVIRTVTPDDAPAVVALLRESQPFAVITPAAWLHRQRTLPRSAAGRTWVAEEDGTVVGTASAFRNFLGNESTAIATVTVTASHRGRGFGTALYARVLEHVGELGSTSIMTSFDENEAGVAFAARRGFREVRAETHSVVDPRTVDDTPPPEVPVAPVAEADLRQVYEVDIAATRDMPMTQQMPDMTYEEWAGHVVDHPLFTADGSFVALVDGTVAAISLLLVDGHERATSMMTGTLAAYRSRGLARAVKLASIAWARDHGVRVLVTQNDEQNAPMLALNERLGYVPAGRRVEYLREETASSPAPPAPAT